MDSIKRNVLLNPGPATTTDTVKLAQVVPDICPREREFIDVMAWMRKELVKIVHGDPQKYTSVLFCGSGTLNIDVLVSSLLPQGKKILIISNGVYSGRAAEACRYYGLPLLELKFPGDRPPDLGAVEDALQANPDVAVVYAVHNETGTGLLNPAREIGGLAHRYGCVFALDTTSTYALLPIEIEKDNIDFLMASAQKGLMAMTGLSFIVGDTELLKKTAGYPKRSYYCNLYRQYAFFERTGMMEFTPPVQAIYAARKGIEEFWAEGEENKYARHRRIYDELHQGLKLLGFRETVPREWQSGLVISVRYPDDPTWDFDKIHDFCYKMGFTIYDSEGGTFRVCSLGAIDVPDIEEFFQVFEEALLANGIAVPVKYKRDGKEGGGDGR